MAQPNSHIRLNRAASSALAIQYAGVMIAGPNAQLIDNAVDRDDSST